MTTQMEYATVPEMLLLRMCSNAEPVHSNLTDIEQKKREYNANQFLTHHTRFLSPSSNSRQDINASTQNIHHGALMKKRNSSRNTNTIISEVVRF